MAALLEIDNLAVHFESDPGVVRALDGISLTVKRGQCLALVGESGSGKSMTGLTIMGMAPPRAKIASGSIKLDGGNILGAPEKAMREIRGRRIAMIFQNAKASLNPIRRVGDTLCDILRTHDRRRLSHKEARARIAELLGKIGIDEPERRLSAYPSQLSGGMCQRIMIAAALACSPELIIADEPTSALDVTTQKLVMDLLISSCRERGVAVIFITHDLALASQYCDQVVVMQRGRIVESGDAESLFLAPRAAYTRMLIESLPYGKKNTAEWRAALSKHLDSHEPRAVPTPTSPQLRPKLLEIGAVSKIFDAASRGGVKAVADVTFDLREGEILGVVGESGSGKSTLARIAARLTPQSEGSVLFQGRDISDLSGQGFARTRERRRIQMVFQDPLASLNPRFTAFESIADPVRRLGDASEKADLSALVRRAAARAGLPERLLASYPHQLSGGQRARVDIARGIVLQPKLLILDEPTSALDASLQAHVVETLLSLRDEGDLSFIFVTHDLNLVRLISHRILVMRRGRMVETGTAEEVFERPREAYTRQLIEAIPAFRRSSRTVSVPAEG